MFVAAAAVAAAVVVAATDLFSNIMHDDHEIFSLFYACSCAVVVIYEEKIDYITHVYISCVQLKKKIIIGTGWNWTMDKTQNHSNVTHAAHIKFFFDPGPGSHTHTLWLMIDIEFIRIDF